MTMKRLLTAVSIATFAVGAFAGGELPASNAQPEAPARRSFSGIPQKKIGPPAGNTQLVRDCPLPPPSRTVGWGFNVYETYGPTYYYPWTHNNYEGVNPKYYPFTHPRLWPNYKTDAIYKPCTQCGSSRSAGVWDGYDDWTRGARYDEKQ